MRIKNKKGIELSLNVVIIGIILLFVLLVVLYIFSSQMRTQEGILDGLTGNVSDATSKDGNPNNLLEKFKGDTSIIIPIAIPMFIKSIKRKKK